MSNLSACIFVPGAIYVFPLFVGGGGNFVCNELYLSTNIANFTVIHKLLNFTIILLKFL